jgi:sulfide:quinone oxidoreductase
MSAPDFIKKSPLSDAAGWIDVDKHTLQSRKFSNVFGLGDCTNTPNAKTAAAVMSQAPVLVHNLKRLMREEDLDGFYDGYGSCPLMVIYINVCMHTIL